MGADFQWEPKCINDAPVASCTWNILHHVGERLEGEVMDGPDYAQAMAEGGGPEDLKPKLIASSAEGLTIWASNHQIDTSKSDDACRIKECHILRDLFKERSLQDEASQGRGESVRVAMHKLLKGC